MTYAKLKIAVPLAAVALMLGGTLIALQQKKIVSLESDAETLRTEVLQLENQMSQIRPDPDLAAEAEQLREEALELQELRDEVVELRRDKQKLSEGIDTASIEEQSKSIDLNNPMDRMSLGQELVDEGKHEEALEHYLWSYDEGLKHNPAFVGVRASSLVSHIADLGKLYPPAREALYQRLDEQEAELLAGSADPQLAVGIASMNKMLDETDRTFKLFDRLPEGDPNRAHLMEIAYDEFLFAGRYEDVFAVSPPEASFEDKVTRFIQTKDDPQIAGNESIQNVLLDLLIGGGIGNVETLAGVRETERAIALIDRVLEFDSSLETLEDLKRKIRRTDNAEVLQYLESF